MICGGDSIGGGNSIGGVEFVVGGHWGSGEWGY